MISRRETIAWVAFAVLVTAIALGGCIRVNAETAPDLTPAQAEELLALVQAVAPYPNVDAACRRPTCRQSAARWQAYRSGDHSRVRSASRSPI